MDTKDQNNIIYKRLLFELTIIRSIFENNVQNDKIHIDRYIKSLDSIENNYFIILKNLYATNNEQ